MKVSHHFLTGAGALALALASTAARADEGSALGISVGGYVAPTWDHSVADQRTGEPERASRSKIGLATLVNVDAFALGGVVDGMPGFFGEGRLTVGGVAGWQPRVGSHCYQLLGELGAERFSGVGGTIPNGTSPDETWLQYVGGRLGITETFSPDDHFEVGAWLFVRKDLGATNVTALQPGLGFGDGATTSDVVGGYSAGVAFRIGLRFDRVTGPRAPDPTPASSEAEVGQRG